jgi:hypothetical protein
MKSARSLQSCPTMAQAVHWIRAATMSSNPDMRSCVAIAVLALAACSKTTSRDAAKTNDASGDARTKVAKAPPKIKFRVQEVRDVPQGGLVAERFAVPQDWKAGGRIDQYVRGTEKMEDSSGIVTEQSYMYNYHWSDGYGNVVHSNDASFDPNAHSNQPWEKLKPAR